MNNNNKLQTFLDVRTYEEFESGHIDGAINIPVDQLESRIVEIKNLSTPIIAYCRSGARSDFAVSILKKHGIDNVFNGGSLQKAKRSLLQ